MVLTGSGVAAGVAACGVRSFLHERDAVLDQPFVGQGALVGKGANDFLVVVAIIGKTVGLDDRPVRQVREQNIGRIDHSIFFLPARAAAQRDISAAQDGVPADVRVRVDQDHGRSAFGRLNRCGQSRGARADDYDIRFFVPMGRAPFGFYRFDAQSGDGGRTGARGCGLDEITPGNTF